MASRARRPLPKPAKATATATATTTAAKPPLSARLLRATWRGLPAGRYEAGWEPGLKVPAADGSPLITDHYFPRAEGDFPTLLVRSPYGRGLPWSPLYGVLFAEQGFHVVLQSCRGTGGSGGAFHLWRNEPADARAAVDWLRERPWFDGRLGTVGPSYLGYTQWALALDPPPELKAMVVQVGLHDPYALFHTDGVLHLENALAVGAGMTYQHRGIRPFLGATLRLRRRLREVTTARPLRGAHERVLGDEAPWLDEVMAHPDPGDPYWHGASLAGAAERLTVPTALITGWHDVLAGQTLEQYGRLRRAGCETTLLVGDWTHTSALQRGWPEVFAESLAWLRAQLYEDRSGLRPTRVRVHIGGENRHRDLDDWPGDPAATPWFPSPQGHLTRRPPTDSLPAASFRHDPADPTPSLGGPLLSPGAGPRDNSALEARDDVLTFTGPPLTEPVDILGPVSALLSLSTDTGHAHVFTRLCDVDARGRSVNICDGLGRVTTTGETPSRVTVPMGSAAHRFAAGHRIRWQISGGAHPRFARSPGTGETPVDAAVLTPVHITLHPDSALTLPHSPANG
ncbi:CocE/NonD family hydrolase [Streptomyces amakusaensis]|uniref:CocE/NonD family hydrolase n=1 Tax=Streptomyces amakusaensis TaxID=67271 RepID=A0ABW0AHT7_9ACTN